MAARVTELEFKLLRDLIYDRCGIYLSDNKTYLIETRLAGLLRESHCPSFGDLYLKAKSSSDSARLCSLIVDAITTNETSWFRDAYPYELLAAKLLPDYERERQQGNRRRLNIWSAACSTGQEPYSIAMTISDFYHGAAKDPACHNWIHILATDISESALAQAAEGVYDSLAIKRGLTSRHLERYFHKYESTWIVNDPLKTMVTFQACNLKNPLRWIEPFDIVFMRNVMIYFNDDLKKQLFETMATILAPNGYLFLGTGEHVNGYSNRFEILEWKKSSYYRMIASSR